MPTYVQSLLLVLCTESYLHMGLTGSMCTTTLSGAVCRLLFATCTVLTLAIEDEECTVLMLNRDCCLRVVPF